MTTLERTVERREYTPVVRKANSWGAILGGSAIALGVMLILGTLGVAIGATTIDPVTGDTPGASTFGWGAGIWWIVSGLIALFAGGVVSGRLAGLRRRWEGPLHGLVTWAVTIAITLFVATSVAGFLISGAMRVIGAGAQVAGQGIQAAGQQVAGAVQQADAPDVSWDKVWKEAEQVLRQSEAPELQPGAIEEDMAEVREEAADVRSAESMEQARSELEAALSRLQRAARTRVQAVDQEAVANVLESRTDLDQAEAEKLVKRWSANLEQGWQQASGAASGALQDVEETALQAAEKTADITAIAGWISFFYLLLTALAAALGGMLGAPGRRGERGERHEREHIRERETV